MLGVPRLIKVDTRLDTARLRCLKEESREWKVLLQFSKTTCVTYLINLIKLQHSGQNDNFQTHV